MRRAIFIYAPIGVVAAAMLGVLLAVVFQPAVPRPNILFIMSDDHAVRAVSAYGGAVMETPNIDRIAAEGALFRNAFVTNSLCAPSRAVMLTGKFSHRNGVRNNLDRFDSRQPSFPKLLRDAGYETAVVGKWHLSAQVLGDDTDPNLQWRPAGFDFWRVLIDQGEYYSPRFLGPDGVARHEGAYVTDEITDIALEFLQGRDESKPFLLLYHHKAPHRNWMPPVAGLGPAPSGAADIPAPETFADDYAGRPAAAAADTRIADMFLSWDMKLQPGEFEREANSGGGRGFRRAAADALRNWRAAYARMTRAQREEWDAYYGEVNAEYQRVKDDPAALAAWKYRRYLHDYRATVRSLDQNIGRVLDYLDEHGLAENTLVVYTSDQGFFLGEHGWYDKRFMYEESLRVPLAMRLPSAVDAGQEIRQMAQNLDFAPTLLDYAGLPVPADMQGMSLMPLLSGGQTGALFAKTAPAWRDSIYYHYYEYPGWHSVQRHYGIRTAEHKLIHFYQSGHWELYDLRRDPHEMQNLYGDPAHAAVQQTLRRRLTELRAHYGDTADGIETAPQADGDAMIGTAQP